MEVQPLIRQLLEAGVHFGHQTKRWDPRMRQFIFGSRAGIHIIDLEKTSERLQAACEFLEQVSERGESVLYVGTKKQAKPLMHSEAKRAGMPYVVNRWLGGTLTNFQTIKKSLNRLQQLRASKQEGAFDRLSKKEAKRRQRRLDELESHFSGLSNMDSLPGCLLVIDIKREQIAVKEAKRLGVPIVAICDTNVDPDLVTHPIPGNDDAIRSIRLIVTMATDSILAGRAQRQTIPEQKDSSENAAPLPEDDASAQASSRKASSEEDASEAVSAGEATSEKEGNDSEA